MYNENIEVLNGLNARYEMFVEQLKIVDQQILELGLFNEELEIIKENNGQEILAPIGKSVFAPVKIDSNKKLLVEVGSGYFIKKEINETKEVILEQKQRLESFKIQIASEIDNITKELKSLII
ncbi:MAG: prefoldin subunit alpha [Nanoarchaeota archaeon]|mgnify:CR=1 FL=1